MYLYARVKKDFYLLEEHEKFLHPQGGTFPLKEKWNLSTPKTTVYSEKIQGFW